MSNHFTLETEASSGEWRTEMTAVPEYRITVARIETAARSELEEHVCVTFQVERAPISFQIAVLLSVQEFDDTEMILVARNACIERSWS